MTTAKATRCTGIEIDLVIEQQPAGDGAPPDNAAMRAAPVAGAPRSWIQIARVGTWKGHSMGPFEFTPEVFEKIKQNFYSTQNQAVPVDFEHATEYGGDAGSIPQAGAPATGWIIDLDNRGMKGLWACVSWLEPGLSYVREKRYRFFSPTIAFNYRDPVSGARIGPVLVSGALTNRPFLDGMAELTARDEQTRAKQQEPNAMDLEQLMTALKLATGDNNLTAESAATVVAAMRARGEAAEAEVASMKQEQLRATALSEVNSLVELGVIDKDPATVKTAVELRMSNESQFTALFSKPAERARAERAKKPGATNMSDADRKALSTAVTTGGDPTPRAQPARLSTGNPVAAFSDMVHERALKLATEKPERFSLRNDGHTPNSDAVREAQRLVSVELSTEQN